MCLLNVANPVLLVEHIENPRILVCIATGPVSFRDIKKDIFMFFYLFQSLLLHFRLRSCFLEVF